MHTGILTAAVPLTLTLLLASVAAATPPKAAASDAGEAIETVSSHCAVVGELPDDLRPGEPPPINCEAIYRNNADRPVFDIDIDVIVGGTRADRWSQGCCDKGTRRALAAGERAFLERTVRVPAGASADAPVSFSYRAAWTGDAADLDVPRPELQYVDRAERSCCAAYIGEVRNVDGRMWWFAGDDDQVDYSPIIAFFHRGKLVGHRTWSMREPSGRIGPDGRYIFWIDEVSRDLAIDAVQVFFRDVFAPTTRLVLDADWQLTGLDHAVESDPHGNQRMTFRVSVHNPTQMSTRGPIFVLARGADFHAIGFGQCRVEVAPGSNGTCGDVIELLAQRDASFHDVRFVTVELGGAVGFPQTPTPIPSATPCPLRFTPVPVPTLASVAGRVWLPWSLRMRAEWCP